MKLKIFIHTSVCSLLLLAGLLPAAARMSSTSQELPSELLFKQSIEGINGWLTTFSGRMPSEDEISKQMEVRIKTLRAAFPSTLPIASKNELEERVSSILSNIRSVLNEYTSQQNVILDSLYKHINDWRKTFTPRQPTAEEQKSKLAEAFKELDTHTKSLQDRLKIYELTSMLPATLDIITKQDALARQHITEAITQPTVPSTASESPAKTSAAPASTPVLERELPSFISTITRPFILGSKDSLAPWLLELFGWRKAFTLPKSKSRPSFTKDGSLFAINDDKGAVGIFARNTATGSYRKILQTRSGMSSPIFPLPLSSNGLTFATYDRYEGVVRIFEPSVDISLYKNLNVQQLNFLHDLYSFFTSFTGPIKITLTQEQSKMWWSLPPAMINALTRSRWGVVQAIPQEELIP